MYACMYVPMHVRQFGTREDKYRFTGMLFEGATGKLVMEKPAIGTLPRHEDKILGEKQLHLCAAQSYITAKADKRRWHVPLGCGMHCCHSQGQPAIALERSMHRPVQQAAVG